MGCSAGRTVDGRAMSGFVPLSERFDTAVAWASALHRDQARKATAVPYIAHLLAVTALVLEHGGDEDQAIAALLHDAAEDAKTTVDEIHRRFGGDVGSIVAACSDTLVHPKPPWRARKEAYLARLASDRMPPRALVVVAADKLHNASALLADFRRDGDAVWSRFNPESGGAAGQLWYFREVTTVVHDRFPGPLTDQLRRTVDELVATVENR